MTELSAEHPFSVTCGGPFYRLLHGLRMVGSPRNFRWLWIIPVAWLPIVVGTLVRVITGNHPSPVFLDASVHARILVSLPLLLVAGRLLDQRVERVAHLMRTEGLADRDRVEAILARTERLCDSWIPEALIALLVVARSQAALWGVTPAADTFLHGLEPVYARSFASIWYLGFALPLLNFLMLRFLWEWILWTSVLVRFARLPLAINGLHPDGAAGIKFLSMPTSGFAMFVASLMCTASAAWSTKIILGEAKLETFAPTFVVIVALAVAVACGPLMLFSTHVSRARNRDLTLYHSFAREYVAQFKRTWLVGDPRGKEVLGLSDIQSLNDLGGGYATTEKTSMFPFGVRTLATIWLAAILPVLPVILSAMPLSEVAEHLGKLVLGGLPG
jgi:hypothetical protein